jgi:hypothetical protein
MRQPACFDDREARRLIEQLCKKSDIDVKLLEELCEVIHDHSGSGRKDGIVSEFNERIDSFLDRQSNGKKGR